MIEGNDSVYYEIFLDCHTVFSGPIEEGYGEEWTVHFFFLATGKWMCVDYYSSYNVVICSEADMKDRFGHA